MILIEEMKWSKSISVMEFLAIKNLLYNVISRIENLLETFKRYTAMQFSLTVLKKLLGKAIIRCDNSVTQTLDEIYYQIMSDIMHKSVMWESM